MCKENWKLLTDDLDEDGQILAWFPNKQIAISCTVRFARASGVKLYHPLPEPPIEYRNLTSEDVDLHL